MRISLGNRFVRLASILTLVGAAAVGCAAPADAGPAADVGTSADEIQRATPARRANKLAALLGRANTITMPPTGKGDATFLETTASVEAFDGDIDAFARTSAKQPLSERYSLPESVLEQVRVSAATRFEEDDTRFESGLQGESVEEYLTSTLTAEGRRSEVRELVRGLPGKYLRLLIVNRAAEILADEWIYILPAALPGKVIRLHMAYSDE
jgi:hypothetical protein